MQREVGSRLAMIAGAQAGTLADLYALADAAASLVAPYTPCRNGCAHCCYQAVPISGAEAFQISAFSGRPISALPYKAALHDPMDTVTRIRANAQRYARIPCPFLGPDHECTVYDARPLACRTHHSIADDAEACDVFEGRADVPAFDLRFLDEGAVPVLAEEVFADIREWFGEPNKGGQR